MNASRTVWSKAYPSTARRGDGLTGRMANLLVKQHGPDALIHAAVRADAMLEKDDRDGYAAWKRILRAAEELQRVNPKGQLH